MSENEIKEVVVEKTKEELKTEIDALKIALNKVTKKEKQKFRTETTQTANNFHIAFKRLFTTKELKEKYKHLIVSQTDLEVVFKTELKEELFKILNKALALLKTQE